jgi:hypothetical protein
VVWIVNRTEWTDADEIDWEHFVRSMGRAVENHQCDTVDTCMYSKANPYRTVTDGNAYYYSDCAKYPIFLRAYFSFKKGLPFSYVDGVRPNALTPDQQKDAQGDLNAAMAKGPDAYSKQQEALSDIRYSKNGNYPTGRANIPEGNHLHLFFKDMYEMMEDVSTETYRMSSVTTSIQPDWYSPEINPQSIKPGTVLYNTAGHVAIVYDIRPNGVVMTLNAAPGNTLSTRPLDSEFSRANPNNGAGFKNWRPFVLKNPRWGVWNGIQNIFGGEVVYQHDEQIADFSREEYDGTVPASNGDWQEDRFVVDGHDVDWMDFIRQRMANGNFHLDPVAEFKSNLNDICRSLEDRVPYVNSASQNSRGGRPVAQQDHPANLPNNIYGSDGDWESFSSPGRDLRVRTEVVEIIQSFTKYQMKMAANDPHFVYRGKSLKADLQATYQSVNATCRIGYTNSAGQRVVIGSLTELLQRLPRMSYDPYDCPELRWGASDAGELSTCQISQEKRDWYSYQQFLRNQMTRNETQVMGWDLATLKSMQVDNSVNSAMFSIPQALGALDSNLVNPAYGQAAPTAGTATFLRAQPVDLNAPQAAPTQSFMRALPVQLNSVTAPDWSQAVLPAATPAAPAAPVTAVPAPLAQPKVQVPAALVPAAQVYANPAPAQAVAAIVNTPAPVQQSQPIARAVTQRIVQRPIAVARQCLANICVGDQVANRRLGELQGQVVAVYRNTGIFAVKWSFSDDVVMNTPDELRKL